MTGKVSHDSESAAHGQQVITACAFIHQNFDGVQKLFMAKRASTKKFLPGVFELPGGHIDYGEDIVAGLVREIHEEFGMQIAVGEPFGVFTYLNEVKGAHAIEVVYFAEFTDPRATPQLNPEDHSEYRWIAANELEQIITPNKPADDTEMRIIKKGFSLLV